MGKIACITGDVHYINDTQIHEDEYKDAERYIKIIEEYNAKATLFVTGRCIKEYPYLWKQVAQKPYIELGAHTYKGFNFINKAFDKWNGQPYGPYVLQYYDIFRTVKAFRETLNYIPISWRTHGYAGNSNTEEILPGLGFKIISDRVEYGGSVKLRSCGLLEAPITVLNDDSSIIISSIDKANALSTSILHDIKDNLTPIITQLHPVLMRKYDNFTMFVKLLEALIERDYEFRMLRELI